MDPITITFIVLGAGLIASEFFALSLVQVFLGMAALLTAGLRSIGLIESLPLSLLTWAFASLALTLPLRPLVRRLLPNDRGAFDPTDATNNDLVGTIVEVVLAIDEATPNGRVKVQGTSWPAQSTQGSIPKGARVKLIGRKKLLWYVEPLTAFEHEEHLALLPSARTEDTVPTMSNQAAQAHENKES